MSSSSLRHCAFERLVDGTLHSLFQLNIRLGSRHDFTHLCDIILHHMFVSGVRDLQSADERECRYIFTAVGNLGKLALKVVNVGLEAVTLPHLDGGEVVFFLASRQKAYLVRNVLVTS